MSDDRPIWGALAEYDSAYALYHACERVRDEGFRKWDAHSPFPVHNLDRAMGLKPSVLPWIVLVCALTGTISAFALQGWVAVSASPLVISGKPLFSGPAFVPIAFELTVLFGAAAAVGSILILSGLPRLNHPLFGVERFERFSDDRFFISIEAADPRFDAAATLRLLEDSGATAVELVED
jgi:hypothetical protein